MFSTLRKNTFATYKKVLTKETISQDIINTEYAVRGAVPLRGEEIMRSLKKPNHGFAFDKVSPMNIGNPQACGQGSLTFNREIISGLLLPSLTETSALSKDAKERIKLYKS